MRVLQVASGREWRGGQNQVRLLCRELAREADVKQLLVTRADSELARRARADQVPTRDAAWAMGLDPRAWAAVFSAIVHFRPDIVHTHDSHALWLAVAARRTLRAYTALFFLGGAQEVGDMLPRIIGTRRVDFHIGRFGGWRAAARIIAISEAVKAVLVQDGLPATEISVIPSGIDPAEVRASARRPLNVRGRLSLEPGTPIAANVAALVDHKDQQTLIQAAHHARARRPDLHWVIAGEGKLRGSLAAEIARLELADRVHLLGYVEEADALIREADVFVMSSKEEGMGSVILNALALDRPVVATAGGGIPEILPADALVPIGDAEALARKVVAALAHPASRMPLPERFTASAMARGVLAVYRSLL